MPMNTTQEAPNISGDYPGNGKKIGPAWRAVWAELGQADDYLDGRELAVKYAAPNGLMPSTLVALISRAAQAGLLERELRPVTSGRGPRNRSFYRIKR